MTKNRYYFRVAHEVCGEHACAFMDYILKKNNIRISNSSINFNNGSTIISFASETEEEIMSKVIYEIMSSLNNGKYLWFKKGENNDKK